jgi:hypothetical protein
VSIGRPGDDDPVTISTRIRILLERLSVGDLYQVVDLARASNVEPSTVVDPIYPDDDNPDSGPVGFEVELPALSVVGSSLSVTLAAAEARALATLLEGVVEQEGDVRAHLDEIKHWVARLR